MNSPYEEWVKSLKEGTIVLLMDNQAIWSAPIIFLNWNGHSATNGYRAQYLYIPSFSPESWHFRTKMSEEEKKKEIEEQWKSIFQEIELHEAKSRYFNVSSINANAERRLFPYPIKFLTKNQLKFVNLIKHIKGYEY